MTLEACKKREISLRYWLIGKSYFKALDAMEFGASHHIGFRKDGVTPEFDHQISIAHFVRALPDLQHQEDTIVVSLLHDVREDFNVSDTEIKVRYGDVVAKSVAAMTKVFQGVKKNLEVVFDNIANDEIASIAKGADRIHNFGSMVGVFKLPKQIEYINEGKQYFLPMIKKARRQFPKQENAYEIIKHNLNSQISLISTIHLNYV